MLETTSKKTFSVFFHKSPRESEKIPTRILETIFEYSSVVDLKSLRFVNSYWNYLICKNYILQFVPSIQCARTESIEIYREWKNQLSDGALNCTIGCISLMLIPVTVASTGVAILISPYKKSKSIDFIKRVWIVQWKAPLIYIPTGLFHFGNGLMFGIDYCYSPLKDLIVKYLNRQDSIHDLIICEEEEVDTHRIPDIQIIANYF